MVSQTCAARAGCLLHKLLERPDGARQASQLAMQLASATAELLSPVDGAQKQSAARLAAALGPALSGWMRACKDGDVEAGTVRAGASVCHNVHHAALNSVIRAQPVQMSYIGWICITFFLETACRQLKFARHIRCMALPSAAARCCRGTGCADDLLARAAAAAHRERPAALRDPAGAPVGGLGGVAGVRGRLPIVPSRCLKRYKSGALSMRLQHGGDCCMSLSKLCAASLEAQC